MKSRSLLPATLAAICLALPALAETAPQVISPPDATNVTVASDSASVTFLRAIPHSVDIKGLIGKRVYAPQKPLAAGQPLKAADQNWSDIGSVKDVVIGLDGRLDAVLVDIGGYLATGDKVVAISTRALRLIPDGVTQGAYFVVVNADKAQLAKAPAYEGALPPSLSHVSTKGLPAGTVPVDISTLSKSALDGVAVIGPKGAQVGVVKTLVPGNANTPEGLVVDVGSFLGIGGKDVRLDANLVSVLKSDQGYEIHTGLTATQIGKLGVWKG